MKSKIFKPMLKQITIKHRWFSCSIDAFHTIDHGLIPERCKPEKQKNILEKRNFTFFNFLLCTVKKEENY